MVHFLGFNFKNNNLAKITKTMNTYEDKINLMLEMIAFSTVDGQLHKREFDFLKIVANELKIESTVFNDMFHQELPIKPIRSEFERMQQFYRLALLMHADGVLHRKEENAIQQISLNMGLNPMVIKRILNMMKSNSSPMIEANELLKIFQEQHN